MFNRSSSISSAKIVLWMAPFLLLLGTALAEAYEFKSQIDPYSIRAEKMTPQQKYLSSNEAYQLLSSNPDILFIDVRDSVEISMYGRPSLIDAIVPVRARSTEFDEELLEWTLKDNPDFLMYMDQTLAEFGKTKHDMIIITCGSGMRSAYAAGLLYEAGYTDVWHIPDGYDGDEKRGINLFNAWQLQGLPWSFKPTSGSRRLRIVK